MFKSPGIKHWLVLIWWLKGGRRLGWWRFEVLFLGAKLQEASDEVAGHVHSELFQTLEVSCLQLVLLLLHLQFSLQLWRRTREKGGGGGGGGGGGRLR